MHHSIARVQQQCPKEQAYLIEDPLDLYFCTDLDLSRGILLLSSRHAHLFVDGRYIQAARQNSSIPVDLLEESAWASLLHQWNVKSLAFDSGKMSWDRAEHWRKLLAKGASPIQLIPRSSLIEKVRAIKDPEEIKKMRASADLLKRGYSHLQQAIRTGISEKELAWEFEKYCREHGASGMAFEPIIAFGANSSMPHYRAGEARLQADDMILIDIGVVLNHYHSDMTRVLFRGLRNEEMRAHYRLIQEASEAAIALCKPGISCGALDEAARSVLRRAGKEEFFVHSLGHGIGLETHEFPRISSKGDDRDVPIQEGMVFTIEPGLYFPDKGGVRFETTVIVHADHVEDLYQEV